MTKVYLDGKWLNAEKAGVSIDNRSFRYGDGFFETIKCFHHNLPLWDYHQHRIHTALKKLHFERPPYFTGDFIREAILELVKQNGHEKLARVRLTVFRGDGAIFDPINPRPHILIQSWPLGPESNLLNEHGLDIGVFSQGFKAADSIANLKSNNYLLYVLAAIQAREKHWDDALIINHNGTFADSTIANLWMIKSGRILTPPLQDGPVAGTMRQYLLDSLEDKGYLIEEKSISPETLVSADEVFLSNAIHGIKWVGRFNNAVFDNSKTREIYEELVAPLWKAKGG